MTQILTLCGFRYIGFIGLSSIQRVTNGPLAIWRQQLEPSHMFKSVPCEFIRQLTPLTSILLARVHSAVILTAQISRT